MLLAASLLSLWLRGYEFLTKRIHFLKNPRLPVNRGFFCLNASESQFSEKGKKDEDAKY
jgi:hypothetical protein